MNKQAIISAVNSASKELSLDEFELYYSESSDMSCSTYRDEIDEFSSSSSSSLLFRCIKDGKIGYATTSKVTEDEIALLVKRAFDNSGINEKEERAIIYEGAKEYRKVENVNKPIPSAAKLREMAMECRDVLYAADENMQDGTSAGAYGYTSYSLLYNSKGLDLESRSGNYGVYMYAIVGNGKDDPETAGESENLDPDGFDKKELAEKITKKARSKFGAGKVKTGTYNIVFDRDCASTILSTFASNFFAEGIQKGYSKMKKEMLGTKIASENVTIIDDPFYEKNLIKCPFDGEGYPTRTKTVIENGILKTYLYNLTSAEKDGVESTGNAGRSGSTISTRFFTFYIKPGTLTDDEVIAKAENGILVTGMKGFHAGADTVSGDFSIESEGFLIENGKKTTPVRFFTVAGNFFDLLKNIDSISCETEKGAVSSTWIFSPSILIKGMSVAGE